MTEKKEVLTMTIEPKELFKQILKENVGGININVYVAYFDIIWEDMDKTLEYSEKLVEITEYHQFYFPKCKICKDKKRLYRYDKDNISNSLKEPFEYRFFICPHCNQKYKANLKVELTAYIDRTMCFPAADRNDAQKYVEAYLNRPDDEFISDNMTLTSLLAAYAREKKKTAAEVFEMPVSKTPMTYYPKIIPPKLPPHINRQLLNLKPITPPTFPTFMPPQTMPTSFKINIPKIKPISIKIRCR